MKINLLNLSKSFIPSLLVPLLAIQPSLAATIRHPSVKPIDYDLYLKSSKQLSVTEEFFIKTNQEDLMSDENNKKIDACLFEMYSRSNTVDYVCDQTFNHILTKVLTTNRKEIFYELLKKYNSRPSSEVSELAAIQKKWLSMEQGIRLDIPEEPNSNLNTNTNSNSNSNLEKQNSKKENNKKIAYNPNFGKKPEINDPFLMGLKGNSEFQDSDIYINGKKFNILKNWNELLPMANKLLEDGTRPVFQWVLVSNAQNVFYFTGTKEQFEQQFLKNHWTSNNIVTCPELENLYDTTMGFEQLEIYLNDKCQLKISATTIQNKKPVNYHLGDLEKPKSSTLTKNTWIAIGVGVVAAGLLYYFKDKEIRFKKF